MKIGLKRSDINPMPEYFERYINLVDDVGLSDAFEKSIVDLNKIEKDKLKGLDGLRYAPDKWTAKEVLQHIIDFERILSYRTLLFARREGSVPQSIDEILLAIGMKADERSVDELLNEMKIVRASTKSMFESFTGDMLHYKGINWKYEISVLAMGFAMIGHQIHHLKIVKDKYYPLLKK